MGFLGSGSVNVGEAILVHNPIGLDAGWGLAGVENECLLDAKRFGAADGLVSAGSLPVAGTGSTVGAGAVGVLAVPWGEEIPLLFTTDSQFWRMKTQNEN